MKSIGDVCFGRAIALINALNRINVFRNRKALSTAIAATLLVTMSASADANDLQIAVIGPLSGIDRAGGQAMLDGVNLYVAQINERGGIGGRKIEVLAYDDRNSKDTARKKALAIARDSNALAVIGHYYSSTSVEGGKIYKQHGIPAVTPSATASEVTDECDWYFRVVPDTNLQGKFAAIYTNQILKHDRASIIYERAAYGSALLRSFKRTAHDLGLRIQNVWGVDTESDDVDNILKTITLGLKEESNSGALFLALQDHEAAKIVRLIVDQGIDLTTIGGDAIGSESFPRKFEDNTFGKRDAGHYTDGIYATTFFIRDIGNFKAQQFNRSFKQRFGREPDDLAATSYDAAAIAVEAIMRAKPEGDLAQSRKRIRSQLTTYRNIETAYKGVTGRIYFDEHGNAVKPFPFGVYLLDR
ncbi:MAG: ABC transporter substrate-binding protein, partial [Desulfosarcina sp.]